MSADVYWEVVIILLLILLNGFFSLAEMSLVAAKKVRLSAAAKQGGNVLPYALDLTMLLAFCLALFMGSLRNIKREWIG